MDKQGKKSYGAKELWVAFGFGLLGLALLVFFSGDISIESDPLKGKPAPEIEFEGPGGKPLALSKQKGTTILLNFWASWCQPCMEEMPTLRALENHFADKGFLLLAFNIEENPEIMKMRLPSDKMPRNVIFNFKKEYLRPYSVRSIPLSVLIDRHGVVRNLYVGPRDWALIENIKEIERVLKD
jgi:thiol-disulfide isomerase/thioredoxin